MANAFLKLPLSSSVDGRSILISANTSASANPIHTAAPSGSAITDEVYLYAYNDSTSSVVLNLLWGGGSEPGDLVRTTITSRSGRNFIVDGRLIRNGRTISAYTPNVINQLSIEGFINRITVS
jgi:hypothetical protein